MTTKRLYFLYHFKAVAVRKNHKSGFKNFLALNNKFILKGHNFKNISFLQNRKEFHSFDEIKQMIEKIISINLPENLFSDEQNVRKIIAEFNVKDSPNSRRIVGTIYNSDGLEKFGIFF